MANRLSGPDDGTQGERPVCRVRQDSWSPKVGTLKIQTKKLKKNRFLIRKSNVFHAFSLIQRVQGIVFRIRNLNLVSNDSFDVPEWHFLFDRHCFWKNASAYLIRYEHCHQSPSTRGTELLPFSKENDMNLEKLLSLMNSFQL